ncbi:MAG: excinuclease ABC subunit UvrC [Deltaproteobacteria bacterium]|nr:excinuclease ABC subunit UvrC [Deltaproteobacteria bacterium]
MKPELAEKIDRLPESPGVYLMRATSGDVVYVGKAVHLRARVRSYFHRSGDTRAFVPMLGELLGDIETIVTRTEKEALLLERTLIARHRPRFNIIFRDDKSYLSLRVDSAHAWPRVEAVRSRNVVLRAEGDAARHFGPYHSATSIRETLSLLNRHFQLRTCSDYELAHRKRPCIQYDIKRCPAPCVLPVDGGEYRARVEETILFLSGRGRELLDQLLARMKDASEALEFERAAQIRDQISAVERSLERQAAILEARVDTDVFALHREGDVGEGAVLFVRAGQLVGAKAWPLKAVVLPDDEVLAGLVAAHYSATRDFPEEVWLPRALSPDAVGIEALGEWLSERSGRRVRVIAWERGERRRVLELALENARTAFAVRMSKTERNREVLERVSEKLHLLRRPERIECYDISNLQGTDIVGARVVFVRGEPSRADYRRYKVRGVAGQDDFAAMREVLRRRFGEKRRETTETLSSRRSEEKKKKNRTGAVADSASGLRDADAGAGLEPLPDLVVLDGGPGQLGAGAAVLKDLGVTVPIVGLAKARVKSRGATNEPEQTVERVFLVGRKNPVVLPPASRELQLLMRIRDETHRFVITFHRHRRGKAARTSRLEEIPGVGRARARAILRHFGSLKRTEGATIEEFARVPGISKRLAAQISQALRRGVTQ